MRQNTGRSEIFLLSTGIFIYFPAGLLFYMLIQS